MVGRYVDKFKKDGFHWLIRAIAINISMIINKLLFRMFQCIPIRKNLIVFESEGDFCDNAYALFEYMQKIGFAEKYKFIWLVEHPEDFIEKRLNNTKFYYKNDDRPNLIRNYYLAVCGHYIYDHCLMMYSKRKGQQITYISHGAGFKTAKSCGSPRNLNGFVNEMIATGDTAAKYIREYWKFNNVKCLGYPRNDYFFDDTVCAKKKVNKMYKFDSYQKVILWMPTFRKSRNKGLSEDYLSSGTGLPLLDSMKKLKSFNEYLNKTNQLMILKVHQLSADLPIYSEKFSNILILMNEDIHALGLQLYQFVACTDMLITDYSSISMDYLLLDKPCIYTLDDYEEYDRSRGVFPPNAIDYMAGYHVYSIEELEAAIEEIRSGVDKYMNDRDRVRKEYHTYPDGNSSKRIVEYLKL